MGMIRFFYTKITKIIIKKEKNIVVNNSDELLGEFIESGEEVKKYTKQERLTLMKMPVSFIQIFIQFKLNFK